MSDEEDPSLPYGTSQYRVLRLASLVVNALIVGIFGAGLLAVVALWLQKKSGLALEPAQFRQLMLMIFLIVVLSAYVVLEYFQHRRELKAAKAARAAAKAKKKARKPEPQYEPIFAEATPGPEAAPGSSLVPNSASKADPLADAADTPAPFGAPMVTGAAPSSSGNDAAAVLFVQTVNAAVAGLDQRLSIFAEFGLHLFVMGGCGERVRHLGLAATAGKALLTRMLSDAGLARRSAAAFAANANTYAQVPNFRGPIDAGYRAMAHLQEAGALNLAHLLDALAQWSIQEGLCTPPDAVTLVATNVAAGANAAPEDRQRVLRAHAKVTGEVIQQFQGREIANLGNGIVAAFTEAAMAVRAAEAIQEQLDFFVQENPKLIVSPRVGVDTEMAAMVNGAYVSAAVARVVTITALAPPHHIYCNEATCDDCAEVFEFVAVPADESFGDLPPLFEARWSRAPAKGGPALEYRQLGVLNDMNPVLLPSGSPT